MEDHSLEYGSFEGTIPAGEYGAGEVLIWDRGEYEPMTDMTAGLEAGTITFRLHGGKLTGLFSLVRLKKGTGKEWLLIKGDDHRLAESVGHGGQEPKIQPEADQPGCPD